MDGAGHEEFLSELVLSKQVFENYKENELLHYCMLLDTLGDHQGMLNCAIIHVKRTSEEDTKQRPIVLENTQRDMFAVACKKYITYRLEQWRILRDKKAHIATNSLGRKTNHISDFLTKFEEDLKSHIYEIIEVIDSKLLPNCKSDENKVFYYKMLADYFRYNIDFHKDDSTAYVKAVSQALAHYKYAMELGTRHLPPTSPIFLAAALNYSVFEYEMQNNVAMAIETAESAFESAITKVKALEEEDHKESTLLLQLLRDNLQLWKHAASLDSGEEVKKNHDPVLTTEEPEVEPEPE